MPGLYAQLADWLAADRPAALATAITGPQPGAHLLVPGSGPPLGSIHPNLDAQIASDARALLAAEQNAGRLYTLDDVPLEVFIETFPPPQRLIIVGAVHVAIPLHHLAGLLGYGVIIVDPRRSLATAERFPAATRIMVEWPDDALQALAPDSSTSVAILTHDPKFDQPALHAALASPARYIGAIGSRTTNTERLATLRAGGIEEAQLARIHAPIGLDLGGQTPAEIALAIMAEVVAARRGRTGGSLRDSSVPVMPPSTE